jgi:predicted ribosomally synthesized peptide with nif11-like leader
MARTVTSQEQRVFPHVRNDQTLDSQLKTCQSPAEAIALAERCGIKLTEDDLKLAAIVAESINGFSFEKLWIRRLGLLE